MNNPRKKRKMNEEKINDNGDGYFEFPKQTLTDDKLSLNLVDKFRIKDSIINGKITKNLPKTRLIHDVCNALTIFKKYLFNLINVESTDLFSIFDNNDNSYETNLIERKIKFIKENSIIYKSTSKIDFEKVREMLESKNKSQISLKKIAVKLKYPYITLYRAIRKIMGYRYLKSSRLNIKSNNEKSDYEIIYFSNILSKILDKNNLLIFIDESSFNSNKRSTKLWINHQKNNVFYDSGRISGLNLILASTNEEIFEYTISKRTNNTDEFIVFIEKLINKILESEELKEKYNNYKVYLIYDNCPVHKSKVTTKYIQETKFNVLTLPPYSPYYNLCEYVFSFIKKDFYGNVYSSK